MDKLELDEARVILGALFMAVKLHSGSPYTDRTALITEALADADGLLLAASEPSPFGNLMGQDNPLQKMEDRLRSVRRTADKDQ